MHTTTPGAEVRITTLPATYSMLKPCTHVRDGPEGALAAAGLVDDFDAHVGFRIRVWLGREA